MGAVWASVPSAPGCAAGREPAPLRLAQAAGSESVSITVAPTIAAGPATQIPLTIAIGPAAPRNSFLRVRGLPPMVSLSEGYVIAPGAWSVPLNALPTLQMIVPVGASGRSELSISLVGEDGAVLAQAATALVVQPPPASQAQIETKSVPPKQPAPLPRAPVLSPADRDAAEKFIARGEAEIAQGNIAMARQFLLRAAQIGLARGAMLLAATHDPRELARWGVQGVQPNVAEARKWYERARELGAPEAEGRLAGLGGG
jgi:hypothetical protein